MVNEEMTATLSSFFAVVALVVAGFGLFGLLTYSITLRTREIGIRMAMGSQRAGILRLILREALYLTLIGIAISVPAIFCHAFFRNRITRISMETANVADDLLTQMYHNSKPRTGTPATDARGATGAIKSAE